LILGTIRFARKIDRFIKKTTLLDIFHATPQSPQRLIPIALDDQCVASVAALRETKMSSSVQKNAY
jgi:hypothetical protein